ncbi:MAG: integrating conjugative element protein [Steroidobacteraceae bacterium]
MSFQRIRSAVRLSLALFGAGLLLLTSASRAQTVTNTTSTGGLGVNGSVLYRIGGGTAVPMGTAPNMSTLSVGIGWNTNLICGKMSLTTTLKNQLNGTTAGFEQIMSSVIQNATAAVASLPALIIQRADPGLYNLLTNGILQARLDFDRSKLTCQAMGKEMVQLAGGEMGWDQLAQGVTLANTVGTTDAVSAIQTAESTDGNNGVPWVGGTNAGGTGQPPIRVIGDVVQAGYNLLNNRSVTSTASIDPSTCNNELTCQAWSSPAAAAAWAVRVLGEQQEQTCDTCTKTATTPGVGLTPLVQQAYQSTVQSIDALLSGQKPLTTQNLEAAGSSAVPITRGVIEALRGDPDESLLTQRLASEVALSSVLEQALTLQRVLLTGREEPNVAANQLAQGAISHQEEILQQEIENLKTELDLRRELAGNSPTEIIERDHARSAASKGIFQGDTAPDRLDLIQQPQGNPP